MAFVEQLGVVVEVRSCDLLVGSDRKDSFKLYKVGQCAPYTSQPVALTHPLLLLSPRPARIRDATMIDPADVLKHATSGRFTFHHFFPVGTHTDSEGYDIVGYDVRQFVIDVARRLALERVKH